VISMLRRAVVVFTVAAVLAAVAAPATMAAPEGEAVAVSSLANGAKRIKYRVGPFKVIPGQNAIDNAVITERPQVDGYITRIRPDLTYLDGSVPGVDVIHLHHAVWVNVSRRASTGGFPFELFFAAGEEKTIMKLPKGYGYPLKKSDGLVLNHMIHNLTPVPTQVYMVWEIDFAPAGSKAARALRPVRPIWMDVQNGNQYPVFNVKKGSGKNGRYTYPDNARNPYGGGPKRNEWVVDKPGVLVATAGHLHPGGLHTDLYVRRRGAKIRPSRRADAPRGRGNTAHLFRSVAKYYEPAGAVSWDVSMTGTRPDWRVKLRRGDVLRTTATYDTTRGAWWESMGIMVVFMADGGPGRDPFKKRVNYKGLVTHGHLPENNNHGGGPTGLPDPRQLPDGAENPGNVDMVDFKYQLGDLSLPGPAGLPPVIRAGQTLNFRNQVDDRRQIYHSITSCKAPCNRSTGIAYPIADGKVQFESNTLGSAVPPATGALEWKTPANLNPGTYTYFCRIHPFMRGAFRVKQ
jgi:plastocyanin